MLYLTICLVFGSLYAGGPWTQQKKHFFIHSSISPVIYSITSTSSSNNLALPRRVSDISWQQYVEYGITNKLTVIGNLNLKYLGTSKKLRDQFDFSNPIPSGKLIGIGNSLLGLKYQLTDKKALFSLSANIESSALGLKAANGLRAGYQDWSFITGIHIGKSFKNRIYFFVEGFYVAHTKLSDEWRANAEIGYTFKKPFMMAFNVVVKESFQNRTINNEENFIQTGLFLNNQES